MTPMGSKEEITLLNKLKTMLMESYLFNIKNFLDWMDKLSLLNGLVSNGQVNVHLLDFFKKTITNGTIQSSLYKSDWKKVILNFGAINVIILGHHIMAHLNFILLIKKTRMVS